MFQVRTFLIRILLLRSLSTDAFALDAGGVLFEGKSTIILKPSVVASDESSLPKASHLTSLDLLQCTQYWNYERVAEMKDQHLNYYGSKSVSTHNENSLYDIILGAFVNKIQVFVNSLQPDEDGSRMLYFAFPIAAIRCLCNIRGKRLSNRIFLLYSIIQKGDLQSTPSILLPCRVVD